MPQGIVKHFYDRPSQPIGVIWFVISCRDPYVIKMALKLKIAFYALKRKIVKNHKNRPAARGSEPEPSAVTHLTSLCSARGLSFTIFLQNKLVLVQASFLTKSGELVWSHSQLHIDFSSNYGPQTKRAKKHCRPYTSLLDMKTEF